MRLGEEVKLIVITMVLFVFAAGSSRHFYHIGKTGGYEQGVKDGYEAMRGNTCRLPLKELRPIFCGERQ
jgi:hypothetical protein